MFLEYTVYQEIGLQKDKKNIVICGYPKSGTMWATRLVAQLLNAPSMGYWQFDGFCTVEEGKDRISEFNCYQSHHLHADLATDSNIHKIIYVVRDPKDILVSGIFHFIFFRQFISKLTQEKKIPQKVLSLIQKIDTYTQSKRYKINRMRTILNEGDPFIGSCKWSWNEHITPYLEDPSILVIRYEDLSHKGLETSQKILNYIGKEKTDEQILVDIETQSFKGKKASFKAEKEASKLKHLRKGIVGDWKQHLSITDKVLLEEICGDKMKELGYY